MSEYKKHEIVIMHAKLLQRYQAAKERLDDMDNERTDLATSISVNLGDTARRFCTALKLEPYGVSPEQERAGWRSLRVMLMATIREIALKDFNEARNELMVAGLMSNQGEWL